MKTVLLKIQFNHYTKLFNRFSFFGLVLLVSFSFNSQISAQTAGITQFIYTSDLHYGVNRTFRGKDHVESSEVNKEMIKQMNQLPFVSFPVDGGVNAGKTIKYIDYLIITGDIANRQQTGIQSASTSWDQFQSDYSSKNFKFKNYNRKSPTVLLECGNHDISNAIGYPKPMVPLTDPTSMVKIYNLMMKPVTPRTNESYNYKTDKINYSRNINGVHFVFITLWPDSVNRKWMENDLKNVRSTTPVIIFTHDEPECEAKHFTNPNGNHDINPKDNFENLLQERLKDGNSVKSGTAIEQGHFTAFLKLHKNIKAYFHGNTNFNEFRNYTGPDNDVMLPVFRVDSPMKGQFSGIEATDEKGDETKLSFQVISMNAEAKTLTVRECLWNTAGAASPIVWGETSTISLK
ncbi:MAG: metallophosphoesterase [Paludibacter sp.]|jgi:predicted MPP superfamily phosphohydrolase